MKYIATISSKGQVVIPKKIRELFLLEKNSKIFFEKDMDKITLRPAKPAYSKKLENALKNFTLDDGIRDEWESNTKKRIGNW